MYVCIYIYIYIVLVTSHTNSNSNSNNNNTTSMVHDIAYIGMIWVYDMTYINTTQDKDGLVYASS